MHNRNKGQMVTTVLFGIYLAVLTWIIVFKFSFRIDSLPTLRGINLIPFAESVVVNDKIYVEEIFQNMVAFIPLGVYIGMLKPEWAFWKKRRYRQASVFCLKRRNIFLPSEPRISRICSAIRLEASLGFWFL